MRLEMVSVSGILFCILDVLLCGRFFKAMFQQRLSRMRYILCVAAATLAITFINSFGNTWLNLMCVPVFYMIFCKLVFRLSLSNCIGYTVIYYIIFAGGREVVFVILYRFLEALLEWRAPIWFTFGGIPFLLTEYLATYLLLLYTEKYMKKMEQAGIRKVMAELQTQIDAFLAAK